MKNGKWIILGLIFWCAILIYNTVKIHNVYIEKSILQKLQNEAVTRWKASYEALTPWDEAWENAYSTTQNVYDVLSLHKYLETKSNDVVIDVEKLRMNFREMVSFQGKPIGLIKKDVVTIGLDGVLIKANSFAKILKGIEAYSNSQDIDIIGITLKITDNKPSAILHGFIISLRNEPVTG